MHWDPRKTESLQSCTHLTCASDLLTPPFDFQVLSLAAHFGMTETVTVDVHPLCSFYESVKYFQNLQKQNVSFSAESTSSVFNVIANPLKLKKASWASSHSVSAHDGTSFVQPKKCNLSSSAEQVKRRCWRRGPGGPGASEKSHKT